VGEDQFEIIVTRINGKLSCVGGTCTYDDKTLLKGNGKMRGKRGFGRDKGKKGKF
jgi:hypothetical protein